jgi:hypothetical protein
MRKTNALAFTVVIGLAACSKDDAATRGAPSSAPAAVPNLAVTVDEIDKISITTADKGDVVLEKKAGTWAVTKPVAAAANETNVKQLLDNLKELKIKEVISSAPSVEQKTEFQFDKDKAVHVVTFRGADKKLDVSFGKSGARGQMVMVEGNPAIYTASGYSSPLYNRDLNGWSATPAPDTASARTACAKKDQPGCSVACDAGDAPSCVTLGDILWKAGEKTAALAPLKKACQDLKPASGRACWSYAAKLPVPGLNATPRDEVKYQIVRWDLNKTACDLGDGNGCFAASKNLSDGTGTDKDEVQARALMKKAVTALTKECDGSDAGSCRSLAMMYESGRSVAKDPAKSAALYKKACEGGDDIACAKSP